LTSLGAAPLASPVFTGDPQAPTPLTADNDTSIATTAFVKAQAYLTANQTITLSGDISGSGTTSISATLPVVNANVGTFAVSTVNAKGQVTAAANLTGDVTTAAGVATLATVVPTKGGTGQTTWTQGDLLYASATNTLSKLAKDATATRYLSNTGATNNPAWAAVNLANGVTGTLPVLNGGTGATTVPPADGKNPGLNTTTTSTSGTMYGSNFTLTPRMTSARVVVMICGHTSNNTAGGGQYLEGRYGTGAPPAQNAATAGTGFAGGLLFNEAVANNTIPFSLMKVITGLVGGTAYWFDVHIIVTSGTAAVSNVSISAFEV
jgi:hypothetical protein